MTVNCRNLLAAICLCSFVSLVAADEPGGNEPAGKALLRKSFLGQKPPEIVSEKAHWLGPPPYTKLEQLHGKVVWLQFNF